MNCTFKVTNDKIKERPDLVLYTGNANTYTFSFLFSDDWNLPEIFGVFTKASVTYTVPLNNNSLIVPTELLTSPGSISFGLYGTNGESDIKRISTNIITINIVNGAYAEGQVPAPPTPDVWETLISKTVPIIGENGNWMIWSIKTQQYIDSGVSAFDSYDDTKLQQLITNLDYNKEALKNKVDSAYFEQHQTELTDEQYPSAKAVYDFVIPAAATARTAFDEVCDLEIELRKQDEKLQTAAKIAKGANKALTFNNYFDMMYYFASKSGNTSSDDYPAAVDLKNPDSEYYLPKGTNVYIKELNVPDLWVMAYLDSYKSFGDYIENNDYPLNDLKSQGYFDTGYLRLAALETQKVDLSEYYSKEEANPLFGELFNAVDLKEPLTTIVQTNTGGDVTFNLTNRIEERYNEITSLTITIPNNLSVVGISSVVFTSGGTAPTISIPSNIYMQGTDCSDGVFTPTVNKRYTIIFSYDWQCLSGIVNGIPIS